MAPPKREFDIVIHGATSFTAVWALDHLAKYKTSFKSLKIALSGRSIPKIEKIVEDAGLTTKEFPIIAASNDDAASLDALCQRTRIVLSFVGPYNLYGLPLVEACVRNSCHYIDITGESNFVARTVENFHEEAQKKGIFLLSCSAFDSLPVELSNLVVHREAKKRGLRIDHVRSAWAMKSSTGASGGTLASALGFIKFQKKRDGLPLSLLGEKIAQDIVPFTNPPGGFPTQWFVNASKDFQGYVCPFIMAGVNQKIVRKSNALLGFNASYVECSVTRSLVNAVLAALLPLAFVLLFIPVIGNLIKTYLLPKPGEGPSRELEAKAKFDVLTCGYLSPTGQGAPTLRVKMENPVGFGGYRISGLLPLEVAAALANEEYNPEVLNERSSWYKGGAVTPGAVVGDALIKRLAKADIKFYVSTSSSGFKSEDMELYQ
jgi:short subunit dehydrogenase-like uncharacterized protein